MNKQLIEDRAAIMLQIRTALVAATSHVCDAREVLEELNGQIRLGGNEAIQEESDLGSWLGDMQESLEEKEYGLEAEVTHLDQHYREWLQGEEEEGE